MQLGGDHTAHKVRRLQTLPSQAISAYATYVSRRPLLTCCGLLWALLIGLGVGLAQKPFVVSMDVTVFTKSDSPERLRENARHAAISGEAPSFLDDANLTKESDDPFHESGMPMSFFETEASSLVVIFEFIYVANQGNSLDENVLKEIKDFELGLRALDVWQQLCTGNFTYLCMPGISFINQLSPSVVPGIRDDQQHMYIFDGVGRDMLDLNVVLSLMETSKNPRHDAQIFFPHRLLPFKVIEKSTIEHVAPSVMRSNFVIEAPSPASRDLLIEQVFMYQNKASKDLHHTEVWLTGSGNLVGWERSTQFNRDALWMLGCVSFFIVYMAYITNGGISITVLIMLVIVMSLPIAFVVLPAPNLNIGVGFVAFIIIGLGADDAFVFIGFWQQSKAFDSRTAARVKFMISHSGHACLVTTIATSSSFLANLTSAVRPLRELGFFAGMCIVAVLCLFLAFLPPLFVMSETCCGRTSVSVASQDALSLIQPAVVPKKRCAGRFDSQKIMARLGSSIAGGPKTVLIIFGITLVSFICGIASNFSVTLDFPGFFPNAHNQVVSESLRPNFWSSIRDLDFLFSKSGNHSGPEAACTPGAFEEDSCIFFWCDSVVKSKSSKLTCQTRLRSSNSSMIALDFQDCSVLNISQYLLSQSYPSSAVVSEAVGLIKNSSQGLLANPDSSDFEPHALEVAFVYEDWETGNTNTTRVFDIGSYSISGPALYAKHCQVDVQCSFGEELCEMQGWQTIGTVPWDVSLNHILEDPDDADELLINSSAGNSSAGNTSSYRPPSPIYIVWGIIPVDSYALLGPTSPWFRQDSRFEPSDPWAQRSMLSMCGAVRDKVDADKVDCWINDFRMWLLQRGDRFPSRNFHAQLAEWLSDHLAMIDSEKEKEEVLELLAFDEQGKLQRAAIRISTSDQKMEMWDAFVADWAVRAVSTASVLFVECAKWRGDADTLVLVTGSLETVVWSFVIAVLSVYGSTCNVCLTAMSAILVFANIICMLFVMTVLMGWTVGPIELVGIICFVGYAITFPLHLTHEFSMVKEDQISDACSFLESMIDPSIIAPFKACPGDTSADSRAKSRVLRTIIALQRIGTAILNSAISTLGVSVFLIPCTLVIFFKLGVIIFTVTLQCCVLALIILPAMMMVIPVDCCTCCCCCWRTRRPHEVEVEFDTQSW